jgi:serine/threonine protein kinase
MSSISCPYCRHVMVLKGMHPGRFKPACPECRAQFQLTVSADPAVAPEVVALEVGAAAIDSASDAATVVPALQSVSSATIAAPPRPPTVRDVGNKPAQRGLFATPPDDIDVPVGLADRTVEQLSRQSVGHVSGYASTAVGYRRLGGYEIIKTLGEGGMGKVYLANQTSLARNVALKVLSPRLASDAQFVSRFTREAFAAAQLSHHNVVQIHDIGVERSKDAGDTNFFSMEFVEGQTLGKLVSLAGKLDPETAVGYALQAARGLKFAHDHGLIHRDVKPDNLLINGQGVVKVADLGLVKRAGVTEQLAAAAATLSPARALAADAGTTLPSAVMGTPAYMPPEQARDAGTVDARADIYSLGCTLYHLLTGSVPFPGRNVEAMLKAHETQPVVPPDQVVKSIPTALSQIVMKMVAKRADDRYANMGEVVAALEQCLGIESEKPFAPEQQQLKVLEFSAERFNSCTWKNFRKYSVRGFFAASAAAVITLALPKVGHPLLAAGLFGYFVTTVVSYQIIYGLARRTFLMSKFRELLSSSNFADWGSYLLFAVLGMGILVSFGLQWIWLAFSVGAFLSALLFYGIVDRELASDRKFSLEQTERMLKTLRLSGTDENTIRHFVCRYCGRDWEEFYEALFGYESKLQARQAWNRGELGRTRPRYAAWRDPFVAWIDRHTEVQRDERQRKVLLRIESDAYKAQGLGTYEANIKARKSANRLLDNAAAVRAVAVKRSTEVTAASGPKRATAAAEPIPNDWMYEGTEYKARWRGPRSYIRRRYGTPFDILIGRGVRLVTGMLILIAFGVWWSSNGALEARNVAAQLLMKREDAAVLVHDKVQQAAMITKAVQFSDSGETPLRIKHIPDWLCESLGCWNGGIAGLLLVASVFFGGRIMGFTVLLASAVALLGKRWQVPLLSAAEWVIPAVAVSLWLVGVLLLRDSDLD